MKEDESKFQECCCEFRDELHCRVYSMMETAALKGCPMMQTAAHDANRNIVDVL